VPCKVLGVPPIYQLKNQEVVTCLFFSLEASMGAMESSRCASIYQLLVNHSYRQIFQLKWESDANQSRPRYTAKGNEGVIMLSHTW
jgi:hypothetical protein